MDRLIKVTFSLCGLLVLSACDSARPVGTDNVGVVQNDAASVKTGADIANAADTGSTLQPSGQWSLATSGPAMTPQMGWNSWNAFRTEITEEKVIGSAEKIVSSGLADIGYSYINIDDGWWKKRRLSDDRLQIRTELFPSAIIEGSEDTTFKPFVERIHSMGLKAGIYTDIGRNACSQAYDLDSPNLPVGTREEREVGLHGHVDQDIELFFNEWGFDYLKVDACGVADFTPGRPLVENNDYEPVEPLIVRGRPAFTDDNAVKNIYATVADAIHEHSDGEGHLSICTWGQADVRSWGKNVGNSWRTSEDITPSWDSMLQAYGTAVTRPLYAQPGSWNDPDMLYIGKGIFDENHLTEARSHFSLWSIINAPLLIGYDLRKAPQSLLDIWGNADVVAVNQDPAGHQGVIAYDSGSGQIISKTMSDGTKAVALLNRTNSELSLVLTAGHLNFDGGSLIDLSDLWSKDEQVSFRNETEIILKPHETRLFIAEGRHELGEDRYVSELPGRVNVAEDGVLFSELDPTLYRGVSSWGSSRSSGEYPIYAGWGGAQADRSPYNTPLSVNGAGFGAGIGILSNSRMELKNDNEFSTFTATVGVDDSTRNRSGSVQFLVYGDGQQLAASEAMSFGEPAVQINADIAGADIVELIVQSVGEADNVAAVWGAARLSK